ncbi:hypothetical protein POTOM_017245 [Populus tomentosa]|uniref:Uncharacterized protein n=1 Tax=Populus tomentosa TaxID=118781 RepID=A0A8X8D6F5_POPTO|nr:hypothetical protein POTOM_017245 [Populus tomentosa]
MESAPLCSSLLPSFPQRRRYGRGKRSSGTVVLASRRENSQEWLRYGELLVDESMLALRKRIHEMKMAQRRRYGRGKRSSGTVVLASRRENSQEWLRYGELLVDESMLALRKRIHEMKMAERNYEPPEEWMEWEKQCYTSSEEFICKFLGVLQLHLMNTRPSLALGMLLLVTMSVPASMVMISQQLMEATCGVLSTVHGG